MSEDQFYFNLGRLFDGIIRRLDRIEAKLSAQTDAIAALKARIDQDVQHLRDLLDEALATDASDAAEIARLKAEADEAVASINAIDPVADFPGVVEPPVDPTLPGNAPSDQPVPEGGV